MAFCSLLSDSGSDAVLSCLDICLSRPCIYISCAYYTLALVSVPANLLASIMGKAQCLVAVDTGPTTRVATSRVRLRRSALVGKVYTRGCGRPTACNVVFVLLSIRTFGFREEVHVDISIRFWPSTAHAAIRAGENFAFWRSGRSGWRGAPCVSTYVLAAV
jgi:hypothetical protein